MCFWPTNVYLVNAPNAFVYSVIGKELRFSHSKINDKENFVAVVVGQTVGSISSKNAGLRLFVQTWIVHGIDDCYKLTRTFDGFSAHCLSKLFLKKFTVLLLKTSLGRAFQVVVILIWLKVFGTDVLKCNLSGLSIWTFKKHLTRYHMKD